MRNMTAWCVCVCVCACVRAFVHACILSLYILIYSVYIPYVPYSGLISRGEIFVDWIVKTFLWISFEDYN